MSNRLYVGNIPFTVTEDQLIEHFSQAGSVISVNLVNDRETGRPRGFGFVDMGTPDDVQKAIEMLNQKEFEGRSLTVNEARPREERGKRGGGGGGGWEDRGGRGDRGDRGNRRDDRRY